MAAIYYDDDCRFCRDMLRRFGRTLARRRFTFVPLQSPGAAPLLGILRRSPARRDASAARRWNRVWWRVRSDGHCAANLVGVASLGIEPHSWCDAAAGCGISMGRAQSALSASRLRAAEGSTMMPRWVWMWTIAFGLYGSCKWLTFWQVRAQFGERIDHGCSAICSPGRAWMRARFWRSTTTPEPTSRNEWAVAGLKILLGVS